MKNWRLGWLTLLLGMAIVPVPTGTTQAAETADYSVKVVMCGSGLPGTGTSVLVHRPETDETYNGTTGFDGAWSFTVNAPSVGEILEFTLRRSGNSNEVQFDGQVQVTAGTPDDYVIVFSPGCPPPCPPPSGSCGIVAGSDQVLVRFLP